MSFLSEITARFLKCEAALLATILLLYSSADWIADVLSAVGSI